MYLISGITLILVYIWLLIYTLPHTIGQFFVLKDFGEFNKDAAELIAENKSLSEENEKLKILNTSSNHSDFAENLLHFRSNQGKDIILEDLAGTTIYENEDSKFYVSNFRLNAPYTQTIRFLYTLEQHNGLGKVSSFHLQKKSASKDDQKLIAEIICTSRQLK